MNSDPLMPGSYRLFLGVRELLSSLSPKTMLPKRSRGIPHLNNQQVSAKIEKKNHPNNKPTITNKKSNNQKTSSATAREREMAREKMEAIERKENRCKTVRTSQINSCTLEQ